MFYLFYREHFTLRGSQPQDSSQESSERFFYFPTVPVSRHSMTFICHFPFSQLEKKEWAITPTFTSAKITLNSTLAPTAPQKLPSIESTENSDGIKEQHCPTTPTSTKERESGNTHAHKREGHHAVQRHLFIATYLTGASIYESQTPVEFSINKLQPYLHFPIGRNPDNI